jgi:hypothetical protein
MISFQNGEKYGKIYTLWKFIFIQQWLTKRMWSIRETICILVTSYKIFHSKLISYEKIKLKKTHNLFVK